MEHSRANSGCRPKVGVIRHLKGTGQGAIGKIHGGIELKINSKGERRGRDNKEGTSHAEETAQAGARGGVGVGGRGDPWACWVQRFALTVIWREGGKAGKARWEGSWDKEHSKGFFEVLEQIMACSLSSYRV